MIRSKNEQGRSNNVFKTIRKKRNIHWSQPKSVAQNHQSATIVGPRNTAATKVLEEARKVMGLPSATLALITIFIQSNHFCFIESMVESEFSSRPEGPSAEQREFLLQ